jgi:hypothetical protein
MSEGRFETLEAARGAAIAPEMTSLALAGYARAGDGGGGAYVPGTGPAGPGKFQSLDGRWWVLTLSDVGANVLAFGADPTGQADSTPQITEAIAYARTFAHGANVYFPTGTYAVTSIPYFDTTSNFAGTVKLVGEDRWTTRIVPVAAGNMLLNMLGMNDGLVEDLTFDSTAVQSVCAIGMARSSASPNCNNNKFTNVWFEGAYSKAPVVAIGSESSSWIDCRFANGGEANQHCCFMAGGGEGAIANCGVTWPAGGEPIDGPATDNRTFGCEMYAPYEGAVLAQWIGSCSYRHFGLSQVAGTADRVVLNQYSNPVRGVWEGPVEFHGAHYEVFGSGNVVHFVKGGATQSQWIGISDFGGYMNCSMGANLTAFFDYDRTDQGEQPDLVGSVWTGLSTTVNSAGTIAYLYVATACDLSLRTNAEDGTIVVLGYIANTTLACHTFVGGPTRLVGCSVTIVTPAAPVSGSVTVGETFMAETPAVGQPQGWRVTVSGTLGVLNGGATRGTIAGGSNRLTVNDPTRLFVGAQISMAGAFTDVSVSAIVGREVYLQGLAAATISTPTPVSFAPPTLVPLPNL